MSALILAYLAHADRITQLLPLLCNNTRSYGTAHSDILDAFLVPWPPNPVGYLHFGTPFGSFNSQFPNHDDWAKIPRYVTPKLKAIHYKIPRASLMGIQLEFTCGVKTPMFETGDAKNAENVLTLEVDPERPIGQIQMARPGGTFGIRVSDREGKVIGEAIWQKAQEASGG